MPKTPHVSTRAEQDQRTRKIEIATVISAIFAALAASAAAGAGFWQGYVASDTENRQLRAYVGVTPGDLHNFGDPALQEWDFQRKNYGTTPAYDVVMTFLGQSVIREGQPIPALPQTEPPNYLRGFFTLFPSQEVPGRVTGVGVAPDQINLVKNSLDYQMVYFGMLNYRDAFDRVHYSRFCYMFKNNTLTGKQADACLGGNDSN